MGTRIRKIDIYTPDIILTNKDLERMLDTSDEWIVSRTGMRERRIAGPNETNQTMAVRATKNLLGGGKQYHIPVQEVIFATNTNRRRFPSSGMYVVAELVDLGEEVILSRAAGHDIGAGCGGINVALRNTDALIRCGFLDRALVVGAENLSYVTNYADRSTAVLFGDGVSVYDLVKHDEEDYGFVGHYVWGDSKGHEKLTCEEGKEKVTYEESVAAMNEGRKPTKEIGPVLEMDFHDLFLFISP